MSNRFEAVHSSLQEILKNTIGRPIKFLSNFKEFDDTRTLQQFELNKDDISRSLNMALHFNDSSYLIFDKVVAVSIDWGYMIERNKPLIWLYEDKEHGCYHKMIFDVK